MAALLHGTNAISAEPVSPDVFIIRESVEHGINLLLLRDGTDGLLVDTGFPSFREELRASLTQLGVSRITHVVHTHQHWDHVGADPLLEETGTLIQPADAEVPPPSPGVAVQTLDADHEIRFGQHRIRCFYRRGGHSVASLVVQVERPGIVCTGDLYFSQSYPVVASEEKSTIAEHLEHLRWMAETFCGDRMLPSHGKMTTALEMTEYTERIEQSIAAIRASAASGLSATQIETAGVLKAYAPLGEYISFVTDRFWIDEVLREPSAKGLSE